MKNIIIVTGGAGFIGSNLIEELIKFRNYKIISLDNYSVGTRERHIINNRVSYLKGDTLNFFNHFNKIKKQIKVIFHLKIYKAWQRPTLPYLKIKYHWR